jgi:spore coat polysaccharide biosynthesis protein SpsF
MVKTKSAGDKRNIICLVQARMGSSRLPGKVMTPINGIPMIKIIMKSISRSKLINKSLVVTSRSKKDDILVNFLKKNKISYYRGSENDVLSRFYHAAKKEKADLVIRITADCPLIDSEIIDKVITSAIKYDLDYCSNVEIRTFPRGYDVEIFTFKVLSKMYKNTKDREDREHVTLYINRNPKFFKIGNVEAPKDKQHPEWRLCVDTREDLRLIKKIFLHYKNRQIIKYNDIIKLLLKHPKLPKINEKVRQKIIH